MQKAKSHRELFSSPNYDLRWTTKDHSYSLFYYRNHHEYWHKYKRNNLLSPSMKQYIRVPVHQLSEWVLSASKEFKKVPALTLTQLRKMGRFLQRGSRDVHSS